MENEKTQIKITIIEKLKIHFIFVFSMIFGIILLLIFYGYIVHPLIYDYRNLIYTIKVFVTFYVFYYITYILPFDLYKGNIKYMNKYKKDIYYLLF